MGEIPWYQFLAGAVRDAIKWLFEDDDEDGLPNVLEVATTIVSVISLFNSAPPPDAAKREYARGCLQLVKHATTAELERLVELKRTGALDHMSSEQMDAVLGLAIAAHVRAKKLDQAAGRTRPPGLENY